MPLQCPWGPTGAVARGRPSQKKGPGMEMFQWGWKQARCAEWHRDPETRVGMRSKNKVTGAHTL